jgi:hypothetical protein
MVIFRNLLVGSSQAEIMTTALDLTKTAASFASDTRAIEPLLYQVRSISDGLRSGGLLTSQQENSIFDIYFKLEHYLITADPIRNFNKEELRNKASISLRSRLEAYENSISKK